MCTRATSFLLPSFFWARSIHWVLNRGCHHGVALHWLRGALKLESNGIWKVPGPGVMDDGRWTMDDPMGIRSDHQWGRERKEGMGMSGQADPPIPHSSDRKMGLRTYYDMDNL